MKPKASTPSHYQPSQYQPSRRQLSHRQLSRHAQQLYQTLGPALLGLVLTLSLGGPLLLTRWLIDAS